MTQLTMIGFSNVKEADEMDLCVSIQNMRLLCFLCIMVTNVEETLQIDALLSPPNLQKLVLVGKLEKVPHWFHSLQSLTKSHVCNCIGPDWKKIQSLTLLLCPIWDVFTLLIPMLEKKLDFNIGFPELTGFIICNFFRLNEIVIKKGVMLNMKYLQIRICMELKIVPKGIEYLKLQQLILRSALMELKNRIREESGMDPKVQHIPKIYFPT